MQIATGAFHLTHCTDTDSAESLEDLFTGLRAQPPALRARLAPDRQFGVGLRLGARAARGLLQDGELARLRLLLEEEGLYVPLITGLPCGSFYQDSAYQEAFAPDWRTERRLEHTLHLMTILRDLLPEGIDGGISTFPLSRKQWIAPADRSGRRLMAQNIAHVAMTLARIAEEDGKKLHLDIEPEPGGLLETSEEIAQFFHQWLLPMGTPTLVKGLGVSIQRAGDLLLEHVRVCYNTCHLAIQYEEPAETLQMLDEAGIRIGRVQLGSALQMEFPESRTEREELGLELAPLAASASRHEVVERTDNALRSHGDLSDALQTLTAPGTRTWRIHLHLPLVTDACGSFGSTQRQNIQLLALLRQRGWRGHLEIGSCTWNLLPPDDGRTATDAIEQEYRWVLDQLDPPRMEVGLNNVTEEAAT